MTDTAATNTAATNTGWPSWFERVAFGFVAKGEMAERSLKLVLDVPVLRVTPRGKRLQEAMNRTMRTWNEMGNHPVQLLRNIEQCLKGVNAEKIPARQRLALVERSLHHAVPAIRKIYLAEYKAESLPESHDRREGLIVAVNVCHQLAIGFKHQLLMDYALPDKAYQRVRERVRAHALYVFELVRVEQRLRAMRYQKLPRLTWVDCHRLYFILDHCEDVLTPGFALNCLQPGVETNASELSRRSRPMISIQQSYLAINLFGLIDTNALSSPKMHVADRQLSRMLGKLDIGDDEGERLEDGEVIIYYGQDGPGFFQRRDEKAKAPPLQPKPQKPFWQRTTGQTGEELAEEADASFQLLAKIIDLSPLIDVLSQEYQTLVQRVAAQQPVSSGMVADKLDLGRLQVLDTMRDRLRLKHREHEREYLSGQEVLLMYNGFMPAYQLLSSIAAGNTVSAQSFQAALAGQSALISVDNDAYQSGQWVVLDRNDEAVHIKTQESQFTHAMFIGQMLAFSFSSASANKPGLGYVVRMSRSGTREIEVTIRILSRNPKATLMQNTFLSQNDMAMPGMLLKDDGGQLLVLHHSHRLAIDTPVQIDVDGKLCNVTLSALLQVQGEFVIYSLVDGHVTH